MILVVDMNSTENPFGFHEFVLPIVSIAEELEKCTVKHYLEVNETSLNGYDNIILSGSALKDTVTFDQTKRFMWLKDCGKPVLGICAGMQTIGLVFGGRVEKCREIGMIDIATFKENILFSSTLKVYALHNYALLPSAEFNVLAESANCVYAIKHKQKEVYGVLFHPEVRNIEIVKKFIRAFQVDRRI
ncbi:gamma-glutamyl-gamma-aminobutyrate hydrolase family protein [Candidatus Bathyarchaeota archaeon]|nr:gamma-glutamyl-gamma-aminobutyrate hydrolase family protein [Candidatus Bathyarchaeota archaeon]